MKSTIHLDAEDRRDAGHLASKIHNAICCYHLLRGHAPGTLCAHPQDMQYLLAGVVENVIFPKGVALMSDESVRRGTLQLIALRGGRDADRRISTRGLLKGHRRLVQQTTYPS